MFVWLAVKLDVITLEVPTAVTKFPKPKGLRGLTSSTIDPVDLSISVRQASKVSRGPFVSIPTSADSKEPFLIPNTTSRLETHYGDHLKWRFRENWFHLKASGDRGTQFETRNKLMSRVRGSLEQSKKMPGSWHFSKFSFFTDSGISKWEKQYGVKIQPFGSYHQYQVMLCTFKGHCVNVWLGHSRLEWQLNGTIQ